MQHLRTALREAETLLLLVGSDWRVVPGRYRWRMLRLARRIARLLRLTA